jgi:hypothetical protein
MSIKWVCKKTIDLNSINSKILQCIETKHFTNNGNNVIELQKELRTIFDKYPGYGVEDYSYWKRIIKHYNSVYVDEPLVYYDMGHGYGQNWL